MIVETSGWSGEGAFTGVLVDALRGLSGIDLVRVEDAPASRAESGYNFLSNEIYVRFTEGRRMPRLRRWALLLGRRRAPEPAMSMDSLARSLAAIEGISTADYADEGMIQYLRTERIVPPYQTRGVKLVELVRIYRLRH